MEGRKGIIFKLNFYLFEEKIAKHRKKSNFKSCLKEKIIK